MLKITIYIQKYRQLSFSDKFLFGEAVFFLYLAKLMLIFFPFRHCLKFIKTKEYTGRVHPEKLKSIKAALIRSDRLVFWKNVCLVESIAARWMLRRRKINSVLYIGTMLNPEKKFVAHAWVIAENYSIVPKGDNYLKLYQI